MNVILPQERARARAAGSGDRHRFFAPGNRSTHDAAEPPKTCVPCDSRTSCGCSPVAGTRTRAVPDAGSDRSVSCGRSRMTSAPSSDSADKARFARASSGVPPRHLQVHGCQAHLGHTRPSYRADCYRPLPRPAAIRAASRIACFILLASARFLPAISKAVP